MIKKGLLLTLIVIAVSFALVGISCTRKKEEQATKQASVPLTPEQKKANETLKKGVEESKKVVVARVNGKEIFMYDLLREMNIMVANYIKPGERTTPAIDAKVRKEALEKLIFEELTLQVAAREGVVVKPEAVNDVIKQLKAHTGSDEEFRVYLRQTGTTEEALRKRIERSHLFEMVTAKEVYGKIRIDEALLKKTYEKDKAKYMLPEKYVAEDIFFNKGKVDEAARSRANEILSLLKKSNNDFSKVAQDGTFQLSKGKVSKERHPEIFKAMAKMNNGEVSHVIQDIDGLHIFKKIGKEPARQMTFAEAGKLVERDIKASIGKKRQAEWSEELKKNAKIEILLNEGGEKKAAAGETK